MFSKAAALRILKGLAKRIEGVTDIGNCIQVTYRTVFGRCSTFISKVLFQADFLNLRMVGAQECVAKWIGGNDYQVSNQVKGSTNLVRFSNGKPDCTCEDFHHNQVICKHVLSVFNLRGLSLVIV